MNLKIEVCSWLWMNCLSLGMQAYHYLRSKLQLLHCLHPIPHFGKSWDVNWNYQYVIDISILFWKTSFDVFIQLIIATLHSFCSTSFRCQVSAKFSHQVIKVLKFFSRAWHNFWQLKLHVCSAASILPWKLLLSCMLQSQGSPSKQSLIVFKVCCGIVVTIPHWMNNSLHCFDQ